MDLKYYKRYEPIDGKWFISKEIGRGAYGTVFLIERKDFTKASSALKIISIPSADMDIASFRRDHLGMDEKAINAYFYGVVKEFINEIQLMSQLKGYTNIVSYEDHDVKKRDGAIGWDIFIRMELLTPLGEYYTRNKPTEEDIIKLGIDICKALEACGKYNIIHRDIKPNNIFVSKEGSYKLGDFGVARTLEKAALDMSKKGTYTYMAPEVYKSGKYNKTVDIYSLGMVMYRLLNNNLEPFRTNRTHTDSATALSKRMSGHFPIDPPANASDTLAEVILKSCAYDPNYRYNSASELRRELEIILNGEGADYSDDMDKTVGVYDMLGMERLRQYAEKSGKTSTDPYSTEVKSLDLPICDVTHSDSIKPIIRPDDSGKKSKYFFKRASDKDLPEHSASEDKSARRYDKIYSAEKTPIKGDLLDKSDKTPKTFRRAK